MSDYYYPSDGHTARPCEHCGSYGYHEKKCPKYVNLAREENIRAIHEDIDEAFDSDPYDFD